MPTFHPPHIRQLAYEALTALRLGTGALRVWTLDPDAVIDVLTVLGATEEELARIGFGGRLFVRYVYMGDGEWPVWTERSPIADTLNVV